MTPEECLLGPEQAVTDRAGLVRYRIAGGPICVTTIRSPQEGRRESKVDPVILGKVRGYETPLQFSPKKGEDCEAIFGQS